MKDNDDLPYDEYDNDDDGDENDDNVTIMVSCDDNDVD